MRPEERRQHLVVSALTVFSRRPHHQVLPEEVAAEAGVSRALFYRYFSGMDEVYLAAMGVAFDGLVARLLPPSDRPLSVQIERVISGLFAFGKAFRTPYIALHSGRVTATPHAYAIVDEARTALIAELIRRAGVSAPTALLPLALQSWVLTVENTVLAWLTQEMPERDELEPWLAGQLRVMLGEAAARDPAAAQFLRAMKDSRLRPK